MGIQDMTKDSEEPRLSRKEREFIARRNEILEAATRLFARKGYHGTTMGEIAKEAEFSTGSLYNFFQNKEELYFKLLEEKIEALEAQVYKILEEEGGIEERLGKYVETILGFFEVERDFFRIFSEQRSQFELSAKGQFADVIQEKYENYLGAMVELMQQGIEDGLFKSLHPAELALCFVGTINSMLFMFVNSEEPYELREKTGVILDIFFNGTRRDGGED
jgi:AcrR family transcriptional regulator